MSKNAPSHRIFQIEEREGKKNYWREVGVAFQNTDGSLNLSFAVTPHFDKHTVQMRPYDENQKGDQDADDTKASGKKKN